MAIKLDLHLASLDDDDPWIIEQKNFAIINDFLQPDSQISAAQAAFQINELTLPKREARGEKDVESPESYLWEIWCFFIEIAQQVPHDHPSQDRLVSLIERLTFLPSTGVRIWGPDTVRLWADLPLMGAAWIESFNQIGPSNDDNSRETIQRGINWHAFTARLLQSGLAEWFGYARIAFNDAFKDPLSGACKNRDFLLCAAAQWIEHSREIIFLRSKLKSSAGEPGETSEAAKYPTKKGNEGICREEWDTWEAGFRSFGEENARDIREETVFICRKAAKQMEEARMAFTREQ